MLNDITYTEAEIHITASHLIELLSRQFLGNSPKINYTLLSNPASVLLKFFMNWTSNAAKVLLNANNQHYTESHFTFSSFVSMSMPRPIYFVPM